MAGTITVPMASMVTIDEPEIDGEQRAGSAWPPRPCRRAARA
jgi:hypothetical protein